MAEEEAGSSVGARWMAEHHREAISTDYATAEVDEHLRAALGDLYGRVEVEVILDDAAPISSTSQLWIDVVYDLLGP